MKNAATPPITIPLRQVAGSISVPAFITDYQQESDKRRDHAECRDITGPATFDQAIGEHQADTGKRHQHRNDAETRGSFAEHQPAHETPSASGAAPIMNNGICHRGQQDGEDVADRSESQYQCRPQTRVCRLRRNARTDSRAITQ